MIRIGLNLYEKEQEIKEYIDRNQISKIYVFYPSRFPLKLELDINIEYIEYADVIMYKFFYRLLEEINQKSLLIFNECLRTQNRSELTYNCAHHYCNQTEHKIIFEHFPFVENNKDFLILLDLQDKSKYKGKSFSYEYLKEENIKVKPIDISLKHIDLSLSGDIEKKYEAKKNQLFDNLGESDPDTVPRQLHLWTGNYKKNSIRPEMNYISRNSRFKLPNVTTYKNIEEKYYIILDFPPRRIDFNDFLKITGIKNICFINSGLKVDEYYISEFKEWIERLNEFYVKASIY